MIWEQRTESRISTVISMLPSSLSSRMVAPFARTPSPDRSTKRLDGRLVKSCPPTPRAGPSYSNGGFSTPESEVEMEDTSENYSASLLSLRSTLVHDQTQSSSGIRWRFANQGSNLVGIAADSGLDGQNSEFERKAFVDGMTYLLMSLPLDLTSCERDQIRSALPPQLSPEDIEGHRHSGASSSAQTPSNASLAPRSLVHRSVQVFVFNLFLIAHLLLPYFIMLCKYAASIERRYKVSENVVGYGMNLAHVLGKRCSHLADIALSGNGNGSEDWNGEVKGDGCASYTHVRVNGDGNSSMFGGAVAWAIEEVTRGISDGVGEGLVAIRPSNIP